MAKLFRVCKLLNNNKGCLRAPWSNMFITNDYLLLMWLHERQERHQWRWFYFFHLVIQTVGFLRLDVVNWFTKGITHITGSLFSYRECLFMFSHIFDLTNTKPASLDHILFPHITYPWTSQISRWKSALIRFVYKTSH